MTNKTIQAIRNAQEILKKLADHQTVEMCAIAEAAGDLREILSSMDQTESAEAVGS